jgi:segregation and condensation protein B
MNKKAILEGILFVSGDDGVSINQIKEVLEIDDEGLNKLVESLKEDYDKEDRGITLAYLGNKYKLTTKEEHKDYYKKLVEGVESNTLSNAALETLAIIAYNGPVTRLDVDKVRGVYSGQMIRKLVSRDLIEERGRSDAPGRPILYGVTNKFLDYFGLSNISELPPLEEVEVSDEEVDLFNSKYKETD